MISPSLRNVFCDEHFWGTMWIFHYMYSRCLLNVDVVWFFVSSFMGDWDNPPPTLIDWNANKHHGLIVLQSWVAYREGVTWYLMLHYKSQTQFWSTQHANSTATINNVSVPIFLFSHVICDTLLLRLMVGFVFWITIYYGFRSWIP